MSYYLGIDASTQGVKMLALDCSSGRIAAEIAVNFGSDLPFHQSPNGFLPNPDPLVKEANPLMWLDALDLAFQRLQHSGVEMSEIRGISGSGQQHGSVYLNSSFETQLSVLDATKSLAEQLQPTLSRANAPIWMDRSTNQECMELSEQFGARLQQDTGSPAIERFTGPQIRKFAKSNPAAYRNTAYIHLVSSFFCSILCAKSAPIDYGDGAGMNLLHLKNLNWDTAIAEFTASGLIKKLPPVTASNQIVGELAPYFSKYGLAPGIPVVAWSGDNPNSLVGIGASESGVAGISLGTSDTVFTPMRIFKTDPDGYGHVFGNPAGGFMSLICFSNGSLAREKVKMSCKVNWDYFDRTACAITVPGNNGRLMLPYFEPESTPAILTPHVQYNYDPTSASAAENIRAILEAQALSMRLHSQWQREDIKRIRLTGGASGSIGFQQILADVFQAQIETIAVSNSAALGAAMRAANAVDHFAFDQMTEQFCQITGFTDPQEENRELYKQMLETYAKMEMTR